jgi:hypothetical protein
LTDLAPSHLLVLRYEHGLFHGSEVESSFSTASASRSDLMFLMAVLMIVLGMIVLMLPAEVIVLVIVVLLVRFPILLNCIAAALIFLVEIHFICINLYFFYE